LVADILFYGAFTLALFIVEYGYVKNAVRWKLVDVPNDRSMHEGIVVRGGGFVFLIPGFYYALINLSTHYFFLAGLTLIAIVSFIDDRKDVPTALRFGVQFLAVFLIFIQNDVFYLRWYWLIFFWIMAVAALNAYNFMDGINGITAGYSFVVVLSLFGIDVWVTDFISEDVLILLALATIVFGFFNFRKKALCFSGDVGSIGMAYILVFLIAKLIVTTGSLVWVFFLTLYGLDTLLTIVERLMKKENLARGHKKHLFQKLVYVKGWSHIQVSLFYSIVQLLINAAIIFWVIRQETLPVLPLTILLPVLALAFLYLVFKSRLSRTKSLA